VQRLTYGQNIFWTGNFFLRPMIPMHQVNDLAMSWRFGCGNRDLPALTLSSSMAWTTDLDPSWTNILTPICNPKGGIGVRISSQPIAALLVKALGHPLTATSANPSEAEPARTLQEAKTYFASR
jgi:hypothetical protein